MRPVLDNDAFLFIQRLMTRQWLGMLGAIDAELITLARLPLNKGDVELMRFLIAARVYLLGEGRQRPAVMDDRQFLFLKPLCEHLIAKGRFAPECRDLFTGLEPWMPPVHVQGLPEGKARTPH